ncbi:MAG TPA: hypothetical protein VFM46_07510 [Pseudomonadales bacterium]|nr:hypothetical protein [Pseudomonadales bacterium]
MTTMSLKQIIQEISYLQQLLGALHSQRLASFNPIQAARLIQQLSGVQQEIRSGDTGYADAVALEIETMLEQAYEILGTIEITA